MHEVRRRMKCPTEKMLIFGKKKNRELHKNACLTKKNKKQKKDLNFTSKRKKAICCK